MAIVVPAILEQTKEAFEQKVSLVTKISGVKKIHVDFADGKFVNNRLLNVLEMDTLNPAFEWEAHLMCQEPHDFLDYQICGFTKLIINYEAYKKPDDLEKALKEILALKLEASICLNLETSVQEVKKFSFVKNFQFMAIMPGFQSTAFHPEVLDKVVSLRAIFPHAIIEVDGGIRETNIKSIKQAGADLLVAGSSVVKAENPAQAFEKLSMLAL